MAMYIIRAGEEEERTMGSDLGPSLGGFPAKGIITAYHSCRVHLVCGCSVGKDDEIGLRGVASKSGKN